MNSFNGLGTHLGNLARLSDARSRSISAENPTGAKSGGGQAVDGLAAASAAKLGPGWKISPAIAVPAGSTVTLCEIDGSGAIQHLWMTVAPQFWRMLVLRFYWDGEADPSIEVPLGDFFCNGWGEFAPVNSIPVAANSTGGFNCYWEMPFRGGARITVENISVEDVGALFFQIDYVLTEVPEDRAYLHAQWRRSNPTATGEVHTLVDRVRGRGHYVGTYLAWGSNSAGWWGEGELKFYLDGEEYPTICGTGVEDYFGGAWGFEHPKGSYGEYSTAYLGMPQVVRGDGFQRTQSRFGVYRFHVPDPIRFESELRVTVQALGWRARLGETPRYLQLRDDIASTVWWYQSEPHAAFPTLPSVVELEVN